MREIIRSQMAVKICVLSALIGVFLLSLSQQSIAGPSTDVSVLTVNLLFSEINNRNERLNEIAEFISTSEKSGSPIHLILLQEVVGGYLSRTFNSSLDLKRKLACDYGIHYNLTYRMANGIRGLLTVGNAILSRYDTVFTASKTLPFESEEIFEGFEIPLKRKVVMSRINIPYFGKVDVYNTHLCPYCDSSERLEQTEVLLNFIKTVEFLIPGSNPVILGGDFNISDALIPSGAAPEYDRIIDAGFVDSYGAINNCTACCGELDMGCTYGLDDNPYAVNLFTHEREPIVRIDYVFARGNIEVLSSEVVFDSAPWVSDHSAVLTTLRLSKP